MTSSVEPSILDISGLETPSKAQSGFYRQKRSKNTNGEWAQRDDCHAHSLVMVRVAAVGNIPGSGDGPQQPSEESHNTKVCSNIQTMAATVYFPQRASIPKESNNCCSLTSAVPNAVARGRLLCCKQRAGLNSRDFRSAHAHCAHILHIHVYSAEREESTFLIFSVFSSYLHHTICYGQKQHMTAILNLY